MSGDNGREPMDLYFLLWIVVAICVCFNRPISVYIESMAAARLSENCKGGKQ